MIKIKVCGITEHENMLQVAALQPDYLGFIFYPPSPRDLTNKIAKLPLKMLPGSIKKVAVVVDLHLDEIVQLVDNYGFDMVQLHGNQSHEFCHELQKKVMISKVIPIGNTLPENINEYTGSCDYILFDTRSEKHGGSGIPFDHTLLDGYNGDIPFFLGGGITSGFSLLSPVLSHPAFHALDINSRFETEPGIKNIELLDEFFKKLKQL